MWNFLPYGKILLKGGDLVIRTYIVVCDPAANVEEMTAFYLKTLPCVRIMPNCWIVQSDDIATYLHNLMIEPMKPHGDIMTAEITGNYENYLDRGTQEIIKAMIRRENPVR